MSIKQVGGEHYGAKIQHWDMVADRKTNYLLGCATKYITRLGKKEGVDPLVDIRKARSFLLKELETKTEKQWDWFPIKHYFKRTFFAKNELDIKEFFRQNKIEENSNQAAILRALFDYPDKTNIQVSINLLLKIEARYRQNNG